MSARSCLLSIALLAACAGAKPPEEPVPLTATWSFSGTLEGATQTRYGVQHFFETVSGMVDIRSNVITLSSSHGTCSRDRSEALETGRLVMLCGAIYVSLTPKDGRATVGVTVESEFRRCNAWDQRRRCTSYSWDGRTVTRHATGRVEVTRQ